MSRERDRALLRMGQMSNLHLHPGAFTFSDAECDSRIDALNKKHPPEPSLAERQAMAVADAIVEECDGCDDPAEQVIAEDRARIVARVLADTAEETRLREAVCEAALAAPYVATNALLRATGALRAHLAEKGR